MLSYIEAIVFDLAYTYLPENVDPTNWDTEHFDRETKRIFNRAFKIDTEELSKTKKRDNLIGSIVKELNDEYNEKEKLIGEEEMRNLERQITLQIVDTLWREHLRNMDYLRDAVGLRGYGQKDPLVEYKKASFEEFEDMVRRLQEDVITSIYHIKIVFE